MKFSDLNVDTKLISVLEGRGIKMPTEIQIKVIPMAKSGQDLIGVSQTGSGKTLAFLIPILSQILVSNRVFHALIIVPTRELAQQIADCLVMFEPLKIRYSLLLGGDKFTPQVESINKQPHIVIGTPGRIVKHINKTKNFKIARFSKLIFDEADRFFEQDFISDLDKISSNLKKINQTLMFTATLTSRTEKLCKLFMKTPKIIEISKQFESVKTLKDYYCFVPDKYKLTVLYNLLSEYSASSIIVFTSLCSSTQKINTVLSRLGILSECLHGKMSQVCRERVINNFKENAFHVLISTDLASRGLDIPQVNLVINFDLPSDAKTYIHRIGRTARAGREGTAISFLSQYDVIDFQKLEKALNRKINCFNFEAYENFEKVMDVYNEVCEEYNANNPKRRF